MCSYEFTRIGRGSFFSTASVVILMLLVAPTAKGLSLLDQSGHSADFLKYSVQPPSSSRVAQQPRHEDDSAPACNRRSILASLGVAGSVLATSSSPARALDMDSFMSQELSTSSKKMSDDEALCKFGQPSQERGNACVRAGLPTTSKQGGVDAYGNVDRGNYVRCKIVYVEDPNAPNKGFLKKTTVCE